MFPKSYLVQKFCLGIKWVMSLLFLYFLLFLFKHFDVLPQRIGLAAWEYVCYHVIFNFCTVYKVPSNLLNGMIFFPLFHSQILSHPPVSSRNPKVYTMSQQVSFNLYKSYVQGISSIHKHSDLAHLKCVFSWVIPHWICLSFLLYTHQNVPLECLSAYWVFSDSSLFDVSLSKQNPLLWSLYLCEFYSTCFFSFLILPSSTSSLCKRPDHLSLFLGTLCFHLEERFASTKAYSFNPWHAQQDQWLFKILEGI